MPTEVKSDGGGNCPQCGERLTRIDLTVDPFPGEKGSYENQITVGCPKCGWQQHEYYYKDYDPYNPNRPEVPLDFKKERFRV
jgi:endogenous inhibitor of DNA gyrase (YacG/DUF329 family)